MKKKFLSLILALCMIFPFALTLTACGDDDDDDTTHTCTAATEWSSNDTHHWHACTGTDCEEVLDKAEHTFTTTTVDPTLDADGKTIKTCSICSKVVETTIPKLTQTKNEMIAVLANAVKLENFSGEIQETFLYSKNVDKTYSSKNAEVITDTAITARKADGSAVYYSLNGETPAGYEFDEYIDNAYYIEKEQENNLYYHLQVDNYNTPTTTEISEKGYVGNNYSQALVLDIIKFNLDYLLNINSEATMESTLKATLAGYMPMYQEDVFAPWGDTFTFDEDDIEVTSNITYSNGTYTATGTIVLDKLTHEDPTPHKMVKDFKVEFEVIYTNDFVIKNYSKFIYNVDETLDDDTDELTELYIINDYSYSKTATNAPFEKVKAFINELTYSDPVGPLTETLSVYVNGQIYHTNYDIPFGQKINTNIDTIVTELTSSCDEFSTIEVFLDEACTIPYVKTEDLVINDYYGTNVYIKITPDANYAVVITNHIVYFESVDYERDRTVSIAIVTKNGGTYNLVLNGANPMGDGTVAYTDKIVINGTEVETTTTSITVSDSQYVIDLYYYFTI